MESWLPAFVIITAFAVILQTLILLGIYLSFRKTSEETTRILKDLQQKLNPILTRVHMLVDDAQPRLSTVAANAAEISEIARRQAVKVDRVFSEAVERLRLQVIRAHQILSGALETVERTGTEFRRTLWEPIQQASALLRGIKAGLEFFRGHAKSGSERPSGHSEEELFI